MVERLSSISKSLGLIPDIAKGGGGEEKKRKRIDWKLKKEERLKNDLEEGIEMTDCTGRGQGRRQNQVQATPGISRSLWTNDNSPSFDFVNTTHLLGRGHTQKR